jgi:hypothetical protein
MAITQDLVLSLVELWQQVHLNWILNNIIVIFFSWGDLFQQVVDLIHLERSCCMYFGEQSQF